MKNITRSRRLQPLSYDFFFWCAYRKRTALPAFSRQPKVLLTCHVPVLCAQKFKQCSERGAGSIGREQWIQSKVSSPIFLHWMCTFCEHVNSLSLHLSAFKLKHCVPGAPLTYSNDGGVRVIFLGLKFWPKVIFLGLWKTPGFFWVAKKNRGIFLGCEKRTKGFFWVC